jgi:hypothetical protein
MLLRILAMSLLLAACGPNAERLTYPEPVRIILDTDIGGDSDDLAALAMLHHLVDAGEVDLLAVMSWNTEQYAVPAIDGFNRWYGHPDIPIGARKDGIWHEEWPYNRAVADATDPRRTLDDVPEPTVLYRRILAAQPDSSVTLLTVGPLLNVLRLLESPPDSLSVLTGRELVSRKVRKAVVMGGEFPEGKGEWNFAGDMPGVTRRTLDALDVAVVFCGFEVGTRIMTGSFLDEEDPGSPLAVGYRHFSEHAHWMKDRFVGSILDNASYDQVAVLLAARGEIGRFWELVDSGRVQVDDNGDDRWVPGPPSNQAYVRLIVHPDTVARAIRGLMLGR